MAVSPRKQTLLRVTVGALLCSAVLAAIVLGASTASAQTTEGLVVRASTHYTPDPFNEKIDVVATYVLSNVQPDEVVGDSIRSYFFTTWVIALPANVTDFVATSSGRTLETTIELDPDSTDIALASMQLPFNLSFEQTVEIDVAYVIPGGAPRAEGVVARVNDSFLSFSIWTSGDPGQANVRVDIPDGFGMDLQGDLEGFEQVTRNGETFFEARDIPKPREFFGRVYGRNDQGLITETAALPEGQATIRAWPDDPDWIEFVVDAIEQDVPVIEDLTGLEWPAGDIEVIETVTPYLYGYGGWFNATSGLIEVGENLERDLILHELAHAWFNSDLIDGRWITEGLAEEFASQTIAATSAERPAPEEPDLDEPLRVQLAEWASPWELNEDEAFDYERYHYNASWWVIRQIVNDVGLDRFQVVLQALDDNEIAYLGQGPPEATVRSARWTHLFDLLEQRAGARDLDELFTTYVLNESDAAKLPIRRAVLTRYNELQATANTWGSPLVVRDELGAWNFTNADARITDAASVLETRDRNDALAQALDVIITHSGEVLYETATTAADLAEVQEIEDALARDLDVLQQNRQTVVALADELGATVAFARSSYRDAVLDVGVQRRAIEDLGEKRQQVDQAAHDLDLASPGWPDDNGPTDFAAALALAEARLATLDAIANAEATMAAPRSFTQRVGLWQTDADQPLDSARAAYQADELNDALTAAAAADITIAGAAAAGRTRLTWFAIIATLLLLVLVVVTTRRGKPSIR